jgi:hypothetical protein
MKRLVVVAVAASFAAVAVFGIPRPRSEAADAAKPGPAAKTGPAAKVDAAAVKRARKTAAMLDEIYKKTIVLITDKYVHTEDDFAAGSAAVLLFEQITDGGTHAVRLIDATGAPYDEENVAKDAFEKEALAKLKAGAATHEQVVVKDGKTTLRVVTPVPVVMERCVMCHAHYADAKKGEPIGAISYTIPVE